MPRRDSDLTTCYVGVSFYRTTDGGELHTAVAQVFNERGDGASSAAAPRQSPRLTSGLTWPRPTPASCSATPSQFSPAEVAGFQGAADEREIDFLELIWIQRRGAPHLFRKGQLPPLRGTSVQLDPNALLLYTRGSIPYFRTYPGMYVPQPLLRPAGDGTDLQAVGADVMALSKMNWNNAQLDERDPLTLRTARQVGAILRHVPPDAQIATRYAYYI